MATVRLEGITRRFGKFSAIANISFTVPDGQFWVLVGPSGCGKSTVLRTIAGLEAATAGDLYIGDQLVNQVPARQRNVAMVFQNYALYPHMTVAENIAFGLKMRQVPRAVRQERVETVARLLDIAHLLDRKPRQLSGGQQQRVALGRAIARQPQVFLLDEPLSNLDAQLRDDTRAELKQLHQQVGITTLYVTHDQVEAMTLADQIVVLDRGTIQQIGPPQSLYAQPANRMIATFLGSPAMNLLQVTDTGQELQVDGQIISWPSDQRQQSGVRGPHVGPNFDLGIRPEHIQVGAAGDLVTEVQVVEPLGRDVLVRVTLPSATRSPRQTLTLQLRPDLPVRVGDRLTLTLDRQHLFLFDPTTGDRVYPAVGDVNVT
jgi:multiple sugar transport system ATP-binding protein